MWYLALELWPYLAVALGIGLATGWLAGCDVKKPSTINKEAET
ncbi:hypothetical protein [Ancylobacter terrae]